MFLFQVSFGGLEKQLLTGWRVPPSFLLAAACAVETVSPWWQKELLCQEKVPSSSLQWWKLQRCRWASSRILPGAWWACMLLCERDRHTPRKSTTSCHDAQWSLGAGGQMREGARYLPRGGYRKTDPEVMARGYLKNGGTTQAAIGRVESFFRPHVGRTAWDPCARASATNVSTFPPRCGVCAKGVSLRGAKWWCVPWKGWKRKKDEFKHCLRFLSSAPPEPLGGIS